jgi:CheY-like chemotaxis protein
MGGGISVQSKPGAGSTFTVTARFGYRGDTPDAHVSCTGTELYGRRVLGADDSEASRDIMQVGHMRPTPLPAPGMAAAPPVAQLRVLVAEDNEFNARLMEKLLTKRGYSVRLAGDGREALKLADASQFDLMLLDVHMPYMDGFQVIRAIRERERVTGEHLPVIALTARSRQQDEELCLAAGMDGFLAKPIRTEDLWAAIDRTTSVFRRHGLSASLLDPIVLLAGCGADDNILRGVCGGFLAIAPDQLTAVRDALQERDAGRLRQAAHKLSGMVSAFSTVVGRSTSALEDLAAQDRLEDAATLLDHIDLCVHEIMRVLAGGVTVQQLRRDAGDRGK